MVFDRIHVVIFCALAWIAGAAFYFYLPIASATNPPMNWAYPRTWEGFIHALTRGQYEKTNPSTNPLILFQQILMYAGGVQEEFSWANMLLALVPFAFLLKMRKQERGWIIGLTGIYLCLAVLLLVLLNPGVDMGSKKLVKVFFTSSHVMIALGAGYGIAIVAALLKKRYVESRFFLVLGALLICGLNLYQAMRTWYETELLAHRAADFLSLGLSVLFLAMLFICREKAPVGLALTLFALMPLDSILSHWDDNEQLHHYFGFWFGHDMFEPGRDTSAAPAPKDKAGKPLYPPMDQHTVLFGGTDPGRFCPTYMIFDESFIDPKDRRDPEFDRRDVYIITQNALADNTYLDYIRAHYNRSAQYQYDKPFFYGMLNDARSVMLGRTNFYAGLFSPVDRFVTDLGNHIEKERRAGSSYFKESDFQDSEKLLTRIKGGADPLSAYFKTNINWALQNAEMLAQGFNKVIEGPSLYDDPARFAGVTLSPHVQAFALQNPPTHNRIRLNRLLLEEAYPGLIAKSIGGLYPDLEIITPTMEDASRCFNEYLADATRRYQLHQIRPGEIVTPVGDGSHYSVSGQVAVMAINGLLTKVIFDKNPGHEFYVEESFPLEWMYTHLVPYGIIMKIEREPLADLSEDAIRRDHEFWSQYSERFIGNWITYDTPIKDVCDFALKVYKRRDTAAIQRFKCEPKFIRDDNAQKAFSKLRNAIGKSIYGWRISNSPNGAAQARMIKEAEFALKQAFAFCPYSPETVFNLSQLLATIGRYEDAWLVAKTCYEFDDANAGVRDLVRQLEQFKQTSANAANANDVEKEIATGKLDMGRLVQAISVQLQTGRSNEALALLEHAQNTAGIDAGTLLSVGDLYRQLGMMDKMEQLLKRLVATYPDYPEGWYNFAAVEGALQHGPEANAALQKSLALSDARLKTNPAALDIRKQYASDPRFTPAGQAPPGQPQAAGPKN
jgi:tetratricopeptide (TPR) repeat protein